MLRTVVLLTHPLFVVAGEKLNPHSSMTLAAKDGACPRTSLQLLCSFCHYNIFCWSISLFVSVFHTGNLPLYLLSFLLSCALTLMHKRVFIIALTLCSGQNPVFFFFCRFDDDDDPRLHFQFFFSFLRKRKKIGGRSSALDSSSKMS